ncbi:MAG: hypothetical protein ACOC1F_03260, partial [Myxococcota bacterium]
MRRTAILSTGVAMGSLLSVGCEPRAEETEASPNPVPPTPALQASERPAPWTAEALEQLRASVRKGAEPERMLQERAVGTPSPVLHETVEGREVLSMTEFDPRRNFKGIEQDEHGEPVDVHSLPFRRAPWAKVLVDGTLELRWETLRRYPATSVYFGTTVPDADIALPRYRKRTTDVTRESGLEHAVRYPIPKLIHPKYDIANSRLTGRGVVEYRL